ncbi:MAG: amino acid ABC transporter [Denitrovibrio sp.]|nr:MAG: amino acid ABC transporter [Denitrovibrio sp.]
MFKSVPIRLTILFNFFSILTMGIVLVLCVQSYYSSKMAFSATETLFNNISKSVKQTLVSFDKKIVDSIEYMQEISGIDEKPVIGKSHPMRVFFTKKILSIGNIYSIYVGQSDGSFYEIINMDLSDDIKTIFNAPKNSSWAIIKIVSGSGIKHTDFVDENFSLIKAVDEETNYTTYERPWYKDAVKSTETVMTTPYKFANLKDMGVTYAKQIPNTNTVLGIDVAISSLTDILEENKFYDETEIYIINTNKALIASTKKHSQHLLDEIYKFGDIKPVAISKVGDTEYLFKKVLINAGFKEPESLAFAIPKDVMTKPYNKILYISYIVTILLLIAIIPLVFASTSVIEKPLKALMRENQLVRDRRFREVTPVKTNIKEYQDLSKSMVDMAHNIESFQLSQQFLFDAFIKIIAEAIDDKSSYTGTHCERVPVLTEMLAVAACESNEGVFADFKLEGEDQWRELHIGSWLHDCGKLVMPEFVIDKSMKLETMNNRIHEIRTRFDVLWRDIEIEAYKLKADGKETLDVDKWVEAEKEQLIDDFKFIAEANSGDVNLTDDDVDRLKVISQREWVRHFDKRIGLSYEEFARLNGQSDVLPAKEKLLDDKPEHIIERIKDETDSFEKSGIKMDIPENLYNNGELYNLTINKGTLNAEERFKINEHIVMTIKMLEKMPFPDHLKNVTEYAVGHHENMIGTGYPRKLSKEDMSIPARIMAVADIYEALTAADRPYKKPNTLSESIRILSCMAKEQKIDEDIFKLFLSSGVYEDYAKLFLREDQIDEVDITEYI